MDNRTIVSLAAAAAAVLVGSVATLGVVTLESNYRVNQLNMKACSEFKNLKLTSEQLHSKHFENVKRFVDANGKGTLIAKRIDACGNLAFIYYGHGETVDVSKNSIVSKDGGAVREYVNWCRKGTPKVLVKYSTNTNISRTKVGLGRKNSDSVDKGGNKTIGKSESKLFDDTQDISVSGVSVFDDIVNKSVVDAVVDADVISDSSSGSELNIGEYDSGSIVIHDTPKEEEENKSDTGTFVFKKNGDKSAFGASDGVDFAAVHKYKSEDSGPQMNDELKSVLDSFGMTKGDLERVLHVFFVAKMHYVQSPFYAKGRSLFENIHNSLAESTESGMVNAFYGERFWYFWSANIDKTIGRGRTPNAVVACYYWVSRGRGADKLLNELNMSREDIIANVRRFVEIFYRLTGVEKHAKEIFEESRRSPSPTHISTPSEDW